MGMWQADPNSQGPTPDEVVMPQERRFQVGEQEIVVKPLVIGDFKRVSADLGEMCQRVAQEHPEIDSEHPERHLAVIFPIIADAITQVLERLFGVDAEYLEEHLTLTQATEIVAALLELNQVPVMTKNVRRALQLIRTIPAV